MPEKILVAVAWPYANGSLHLGHIAGCYLPADIFARYHRTIGNDVLMVSGSDQHGTPITVRAEQEGVSPAEVATRYHEEFLRSWRDLGISFDLFTRTGTDNHREVVHDIFNTLLAGGDIYRDSMEAFYCETDRRFLPDRYVEGTCPNCGYAGARGDQCDNCGKPLNPTELIDPRCRFCGNPPVIRETEHFFLRLSAYNDRLREWVAGRDYWRPNVLNFTNGWLREGLRDRAITRDIEWGVPVPVEGFERKRIYVWFEAVIGYLSASKEWAREIAGDPERWREWWQGPGRSYYFIGKDNIPFHTIIWPAMLMGYGDHNLPYDVPANEYLNLEGAKFSTSRGWAAWVPDFLAKYDADALRYALAINLPETRDADFSLSEFIRRNNDELVATYGNLPHRTLTFIQRYFGGLAPGPASGQEIHPEVVREVEAAFERVGRSLEAARFKDAIKDVMTLAQFGNRHFDETAPWRLRKEDPDACATALATFLYLINGLKVLAYPFLPFSSQRLHEYLGYSGSVQEQGWRNEAVPAGTKLPAPAPSFAKLEEPEPAQPGPHQAKD